MLNRYNKIEVERIRREIERHGSDFFARRAILDQYGERKSIEEIGKIRGIYHTQEGREERRLSDGTITTEYGSPMMLVLFEDGKKLKMNDIIETEETTYRVARKNNIMHYNIVYDISLEEVM